MKKKSFVNKPLNILLAFILIIFLLFNILASQAISSLYVGVVNDNRNSIVEFLKRIKPLPIFQSQLDHYKNIYGKTIEQEVYAQDIRVNNKIIQLEKLLALNPESRDVLYNLYILYSEKGNRQKAQEYLRKAQEIDPNINN